MKYVVIIEKGPNNLSAYLPDLPGCVSTGQDIDEVLRNIREAVEGHIEVMREYGDPFPSHYSRLPKSRWKLPFDGQGSRHG
jgi:predicted RNase H-like HicB family nuclease